MLVQLVLSVALLACSASETLDGNDASPHAALAKEAPMTANEGAASDDGALVSGLPFSHGKSFRTLDEYLAHLRQYAAPIDQPWWREIRPGVYEHVKRMPGAPREVATRAELMERFGFKS